jgi:hypothetical protein
MPLSRARGPVENTADDMASVDKAKPETHNVRTFEYDRITAHERAR